MGNLTVTKEEIECFYNNLVQFQEKTQEKNFNARKGLEELKKLLETCPINQDILFDIYTIQTLTNLLVLTTKNILAKKKTEEEKRKMNNTINELITLMKNMKK